METRKFKIIACLLLLFFSLQINGQTNSLPIIPAPLFSQLDPGHFLISDTTTIIAGESSPEANWLKDYLEKTYGLHVKVTPHYPPFHHFIALLSKLPDNIQHSQESYDMTITKKGITIRAYGDAGFFYAIQSLVQMMPADPAAPVLVPCCQVIDEPRFQWRGMHLDCSRHFFSEQEIMRYLDLLALYKFNTFHWHLTDDQGWRIEIKKYPLLTKIGSQRSQTLIGKPSSKNKYDGLPYGGFYTQEAIRRIVAYATLRHITIVPEIELPGHSLAALASYPQLSCTGGPFRTGDTWGVYDDVYCAGNDSTLIFLKDVLSEVIDLFPGKYVHIGGDECPKLRWQKCPKCQKRIADEKLKNENELQTWMIAQVETFLLQKGRQLIGWDEILEGGLTPNAIVMSWRGTAGGIAAARQEHFVVMSPSKPCYFDHYQSRNKAAEPVAIGGYNPVDSVYRYDPVPAELSPDAQHFIMGGQGNVWTEYIDTFSKVEYMAVPRMCALSEALWTPVSQKSYPDFISRLKKHAALLDRLQVNYAKHALK